MRRLLLAALSAALCLTLAPLGFAPAAAQSPGDGEAPPSTPPLYDWQGEPAMISNQGVYRSHEFIYQDYIYDDHGVNTDGIDHTDAPFGGGPDPQDPADPRLGSSGGQIRHAGDFFYAADGDGYYQNVADLIEFRVAQTDDAVHYFFRLGALDEPDAAVIGMCIDTDERPETGLQEWPFGARFAQALGCDQFYTVYGTGASITAPDGTSTDLRDVGGEVRADVEANTIELRVPKAVADPGDATWRYYVGSGVWDAAAGTWLQVPPTPSMPGQPVATGGGVDAPQIWDLLSNNSEPNSYWREVKQANDLFAETIEEHYVDVRFPRLRSAVSDPDPQLTGVIDRIYVSDFTLDPSEGITVSNKATRNYVYWGRYQPYAVVVPTSYWEQLERDPGTRLPFDLCLHPLNGNHHVEIYYDEVEARRTYVPGASGTTTQTGDYGFDEFESRIDRQNLVYACVNGRGEAVGYTGGIGLTDALEVYAEVQKRYAIDVDKRTLHGISLGAIGTWYMASLYPDQFSAALPSIFTPGFGCDTPSLANFLNLPVFYTIGTFDEFGQGAFGDCVGDQMETLGNEYVYYHHLTRFHELSLGTEALPFSEPLFYSRERVENPARVRYLYDPSRFSEQFPGTGTAYWVSGMRPTEDTAAEIDVTSLARADELPTDEVVFRGQYENTMEGYEAEFRGLLRVTPEEFAEIWKPAEFQEGWNELSLDVTHNELPPEEVANGFRLTATDLAAVTIDAARMKLDRSSPITGELTGGGPLELTVTGPFGPATTATVDGQAAPVTITDGNVTVALELTGDVTALVIAPGPLPGPTTPEPTMPGPTTPAGGVRRSGGADRIATAVEISKATFPSASTVVVARADEYADALTGSPLATHLAAPLLLSDSTELPAATADEIARLGAEEAVLLGGTSALSDQVARQLRDAGVAVRRIGGANRFGTAALIAGELPASPEVFLTEGAHADRLRGWPDALSASGLASTLREPILLTYADSLPDETARTLEADQDVVVVGGEAAVHPDVAEAVDERAGSVRRIGGANRYATSALVADEALARGIDPAVTWLATGLSFPDGLVAAAAAGADDGVLLLVDGEDIDASPESISWLTEHGDMIATANLAGGRAAIGDQAEARIRALVE